MTDAGRTTSNPTDLIASAMASAEVQEAIGFGLILPGDEWLAARLDVVQAQAAETDQTVRFAQVATRIITLASTEKKATDTVMQFRPQSGIRSPSMSVVEALVLRSIFGEEEPLPVPQLARMVNARFNNNDVFNTVNLLTRKSSGPNALFAVTEMRDYSKFAIAPFVAFAAATDKPPQRFELPRN